MPSGRLDRFWLRCWLSGGGYGRRQSIRMTDEEFRKSNEGDDNQKHSSNRNDIVGEYKSLVQKVWGLRSGQWRWPSRRRYIGLWHLQLGSGNRGNLRERDRQRGYGLSGSSGYDAGLEARCNFGAGPASPGTLDKAVMTHVLERLG